MQTNEALCRIIIKFCFVFFHVCAIIKTTTPNMLPVSNLLVSCEANLLRLFKKHMIKELSPTLPTKPSVQSGAGNKQLDVMVVEEVLPTSACHHYPAAPTSRSPRVS